MSARPEDRTTGGAPGRAVRFVMPGGVDDRAAPSGGNVYDRRVCQELPTLGWRVHEHAVAGDWPRPGTGPEAEVARVLRETPDGDAVLMDGLVACGIPAVVVPEAARLRLAVLVHLPLAEETGLAPDTAAELDAAERLTLRSAAAVVAPSAWAAKRLTQHHGLTPDRVHVAAPGTDTAPLAPGTAGDGSGAAGPRLLCVASLTPRKAQHTLVEALSHIADLPWTCELVGGTGHDPDHVRQVRGLITGHRLTGRVRMTGPRSGAALESCYAAADLLVLASRAETFGMVATEALARGVPVLATAAGGLPEAVGQLPDGSVPGTLVPPGDREALVAALRQWLTDPAERHRTKAAARQRRNALAGWDTTSRVLARTLERLCREALLETM
ncbi:glycosyltransferase family 4 protein (plasmid) [Streptomyces globisporus]|uniref:glycosyltransferase family 4 protein n=1 Tax=Streptomyces globisporus TaxID=1908 RepID=UPI002F91B10B|nr:glycosyltransferase family 4 protein [Streptomyces globisporus]